MAFCRQIKASSRCREIRSSAYDAIADFKLERLEISNSDNLGRNHPGGFSNVNKYRHVYSVHFLILDARDAKRSKE